jgi:ABC-type multidrug transport system fused ATPase/permease subunit
LRPGETTALVGASGAGKTTCANLLMRFWDPQQGRISISGCDIRDLPLEALRRRGRGLTANSFRAMLRF